MERNAVAWLCLGCLLVWQFFKEGKARKFAAHLNMNLRGAKKLSVEENHQQTWRRQETAEGMAVSGKREKFLSKKDRSAPDRRHQDPRQIEFSLRRLKTDFNFKQKRQIAGWENRNSSLISQKLCRGRKENSNISTWTSLFDGKKLSLLTQIDVCPRPSRFLPQQTTSLVSLSLRQIKLMKTAQLLVC